MPFFVYGYLPIHPAQLYSSLYGLLLFVFLHLMLKRRRFEGQVLAILLMCESVFRFGIEYVRFYEEAMQIDLDTFAVTWNQVFSVMLFALGMFLYLRLRPRNVSPRPPAASIVN